MLFIQYLFEGFCEIPAHPQNRIVGKCNIIIAILPGLNGSNFPDVNNM
jgi:hypothetical protein